MVQSCFLSYIQLRNFQSNTARSGYRSSLYEFIKGPTSGLLTLNIYYSSKYLSCGFKWVSIVTIFLQTGREIKKKKCAPRTTEKALI